MKEGRFAAEELLKEMLLVEAESFAAQTELATQMLEYGQLDAERTLQMFKQFKDIYPDEWEEMNIEPTSARAIATLLDDDEL